MNVIFFSLPPTHMLHMYVPFAYVFNKFEIFSGMTICSEQYILDSTMARAIEKKMESFACWQEPLLFFDDLRASSLYKIHPKFLAHTAPSSSSICRRKKKLFADSTQKSF
jgi:hypothetical protein